MRRATRPERAAPSTHAWCARKDPRVLPKPPTYHVTASGEQWELAPEGEPAIAVDPDRQILVDEGLRIAQSVRGALVVHDQGGAVEEERSFS